MKRFRRDKGITLVALVVTIVVLLILSGITISTLFGDNGIISASKKSADDVNAIQDSTQQEIQNLANDLKEGLDNTPSRLKASQVAAEPTKYYGQKVNYTAGSESFQNSLGVDWKIFYADESHIYLITSDYVPISSLPYSTNSSGASTSNKPINVNSSYPKSAQFGQTTDSHIMSDYSGSNRISDDVKYLNKSYFDYLTTNNTSSSYTNIKAVAYMLDINAWRGYKDINEKAEFVIGGPTIEMIMSSYSQKYNYVNNGINRYQAKATSVSGYKISTDYGSTWKDYISSSEYLSTSDPLYVITSQNNALAYWEASPSNLDSYGVMSTYYNGNTYYGRAGFIYDPFDTGLGFRPVIALKSSCSLVEQSDNSFNIK